MADAVNPPSPLHSATSKPLSGDAAKPPTKRKPPTSTTTHPPKRPHINLSSSNSDEIKDTASSEPEIQGDELVEMPDDVVYQELDEYEVRYGINPVVDCDHMQKFCLPYIHMGIGNEGGWETKIRRLKFKFNNESGPLVPDYQREEFLLWKKMFARQPPPDTGSTTN